jgi:DNA-binding CsgD family transcriptional regulator
MTIRAVVVVHREAMVAEGIAAGLSTHPGLLPIAVATTAREGEMCAERADVIALDELVDGAVAAATRLRRQGRRVVMIGERTDDGADARVSPTATIASLAKAMVPEEAVASKPRLSPREKEVLGLVAKGLAAKQVARRLGISPKTVELHKSRIFAKLGVNNQTAAVSLALSNELRSGQPWIPSST